MLPWGPLSFWSPHSAQLLLQRITEQILTKISTWTGGRLSASSE